MIEKSRESDQPVKIRWIDRIRFQLAIGLILSIGLPVILRYFWSIYDGVESFSTNIIEFGFFPTNFFAALGGSIAIIIAFFLQRQFSKFPGVSIGPNMLLSYSLVFAGLFGLLLLYRVEYSRFILFSGFFISLAWFSVVGTLSNRRRNQSMAIVPGGGVVRLKNISSINFHWLESPDDFFSGIDSVAADLRCNFSSEWQAFLAKCALADVPVFHFKQVEEFATGRVSIEHISENAFGSVIPSHLYLKTKVVFDLILAILLLPLVVPICCVVAVVILITSGRPILFVQDRIGYRGRTFSIVKFRTMNADETNQSIDTEDNLAVEVAKTKKDDHRITPFGRVLRKFRLDELPQIINIVKGEMSWIGPRPEAVPLSREYEAHLPFYAYRHIVRPGISGWAQVNQGHVVEVDDAMDKLHYDFFYIKNISLWLDTIIGVRTLLVIIRGFGAK